MAGETLVIAVEGLDDAIAAALSRQKNVDLRTVQSLNRTADVARKLGADEIEKQINFPQGYLAPRTKRLAVSQKATRARKEAIVTARGRATSLARFVTNSPGKGEAPRVEVSRGKARYMRGAFLIRLKSGDALTETKNNMGLAIRLKPGDSLRNKKSVMRMRNGLYLLYGPAVNQVFASVAGEMTDDVAEIMQTEFTRLMDLD